MSVENMNPKGWSKAAAYVSTYRAQLAEWPIQAEAKVLEVATGRMHLVVWGPSDAPPLLLLHGGGGSSVGWINQAEALGAQHRLYALDLPGHAGLSVAKKPLKKVAETMTLIDEVLDTLQLSRVDILGISLGGAYAAHYALRSPQRINRLVMIAPSPLLLPLRFSFFMNNLRLLFGTSGIEGFMRWLGPKQNAGQPLYEKRLQQVVHWFGAARRHFGLPNMMGMEWPAILRNDQLRALLVPTLVILGEHEVVYDARKGIARAALIPNVQTALIPGAGHDVMWSQPERLNATITAFLSSH